MFPNLEAEQTRNGHTNGYVAKKLGISRGKYESKKRSGAFRLSEVKTLCEIYNVPIDYLFTEAIIDNEPI
ncbi:MAG: helix-turn-helix domain-containing protein [Chitinispirillales bacterium]|jgi:hypothetical protein|nr:helix-turn-helix domain-containing protein [Chitinispirillales bacterium]